MMISDQGETQKYIEWLRTLSEEQRLGNLLQIQQEFCKECGRIQGSGRRCQCWNDE